MEFRATLYLTSSSFAAYVVNAGLRGRRPNGKLMGHAAYVLVG